MVEPRLREDLLHRAEVLVLAGPRHKPMTATRSPELTMSRSPIFAIAVSSACSRVHLCKPTAPCAMPRCWLRRRGDGDAGPLPGRVASSAGGLAELAHQPGRQPPHSLRCQVDAVAAHLHAVDGPGEGAV